MSHHADVLRSLNAPLLVRAAQAGADALDEIPRLKAVIAALEAATVCPWPAECLVRHTRHVE